MKINAINTYPYINFSSLQHTKKSNVVNSIAISEKKEKINNLLDKLMFLDKKKGDFDRYLDKRTLSSDGLLDNINYELSYSNGDITGKELQKCLKKHILTDKQINAMLPEGNYIHYNIDVTGAKLKLQFLSKMLSSLCKIMDENPQQENEKINYYFQRISNIYSNNVALENYKKKELISSKLKYSDELPVNKEIKLSKEDERLLTHVYSNKDGELDLKRAAESWKYDYQNEKAIHFSNDVINLLLQQFPKYETDKKMQPVVRWMQIGDMDKFADKIIPEVNEILTLDRMQSCSKNFHFCETYFSDDSPRMNVKYVIYPKNEKVSKASDMGWSEYGCSEVIYPSGSQFKILHKGFEENKAVSPLGNGSTIRYVVYMQEV